MNWNDTQDDDLDNKKQAGQDLSDTQGNSVDPQKTPGPDPVIGQEVEQDNFWQNNDSPMAHEPDVDPFRPDASLEIDPFATRDEQHTASAIEQNDVSEERDGSLDSDELVISEANNHDTEDEPRKKPSMLKTYALIGGVLTVLVGVVGTGLSVKYGKSSNSSANTGQQDSMAVPMAMTPAAASTQPTPVAAQINANNGNGQTGVRRLPDDEPSFLSNSFPDNSLQQAPTQRATNTQPSRQGSQSGVEQMPDELAQSTTPVPYVDMAALQALVDEDVIIKINQLAKAQTQLISRVTDLETQTKSIQDDQEQYQKDYDALKAMVDALEKKSSEKPEVKVATAPPAKATPRPAPAAANPAPRRQPAPKPVVNAPQVKPNTDLSTARVVGVYPSRNPTLAYVVSDKGLTTVRPGDLVLGARVLRLDGMTVVTTAGRIMPQ